VTRVVHKVSVAADRLSLLFRSKRYIRSLRQCETTGRIGRQKIHPTLLFKAISRYAGKTAYINTDLSDGVVPFLRQPSAAICS
jgi:hypothetical protein